LQHDKEAEPNKFDGYYEKIYAQEEAKLKVSEHELYEPEKKVFDTEEAKFAGSNSLSNLSAKLVEIAGSANVSCYINAKTLKASGSLKVGGDITAEEIEASGSIEVIGAVKCINAEFSGSCLVDSGFWVKEKLVFRGSAKSSYIRCGGETSISGHLTVESVNSKKVVIKGGGETKVILSNVCIINTAGSGAAGFTLYLGLKGYNHFRTDRVVATEELSMDRCEARVAAGGIVRIGNKCKIGRVFYTKDCQVEDKARLDEAPVRLDRIDGSTGKD
jgi:cytoskeletal protein CcmA (bactofilin family)